jgi:hypothetical protein
MKIYLRYLIYVLCLVLYIYVAATSYGYDDEFINIELIKSLTTNKSLADYIILKDVHPPLHYLINKWLFEIFQNWSIVRTISGILLCISGIFFIEKTRKNDTSWIRDLTLVLIILLNPAYLLWGTSIRWYSYFVPLLFILLSANKTTNSFRHWIFFSILITILCYIGYGGLFLFPSLFLIHWTKDLSDIKKKIKNAAAAILLFAVLYAYQLFILIKFQVHNSGDQTFSLLKSLIGFISSQVSNQGLFPASLAGIFSILGFSILYLRDLLITIKNKKIETGIISYLIGIIIFFITGIAGKMRNFVILSPFQNFLFFNPSETRFRKIYITAICLIFSANIWGVYNVTMHIDTSKNSWNIPIEEILETLKKEDKNSVLILNHDSVISHVLVDKGYHIYSPLIDTKNVNTASIKKVIVLRTYIGSIPPDQYKKLYTAVEFINGKDYKPKITKIGKDNFYNIKRKIEASYPEYSIEISQYNKPKNLQQLLIWKNKIK